MIICNGNNDKCCTLRSSLEVKYEDKDLSCKNVHCLPHFDVASIVETIIPSFVIALVSSCELPRKVYEVDKSKRLLISRVSYFIRHAAYFYFLCDEEVEEKKAQKLTRLATLNLLFETFE